MKHLEIYNLGISGKEKVKIPEKSEQTLSKISEGMNQCTSISVYPWQRTLSMKQLEYPQKQSQMTSSTWNLKLDYIRTHAIVFMLKYQPTVEAFWQYIQYLNFKRDIQIGL